MTETLKTPNLDRIRDVRNDSEAVQAFLDWMAQSKGYLIARYVPEDENYNGGHFFSEQPVPVFETFEQLMADHFDVDLKAASHERDAVYKHYVAQLQAAQDKETNAA